MRTFDSFEYDEIGLIEFDGYDSVIHHAINGFALA
jgi:hypothetical protein